ncbi:DUF732 domain-containing protein [Mycobacterium antarcticum]|uniref:DUF732 domain-containing protein n=1 Tax=Mycolicibacterium sp. TUM20984 TaxID=3023368 RepID=UPI0023835C46|nr:DUF732 domain-containing protein [Mycolicibacterium sp. TUM20984]GLP79768.1 hypothetical protein TUM20984_11880 [Mycolicibacterium sp. TUM20984]
MKTTIAITLAIGIAIGAAPTAAAEESDYLDQLQPSLAFLSTEQLLTEGYRVCQFIGAGRPSADAIPMVVKDLQVTVATAYTLVPAALSTLDC